MEDHADPHLLLDSWPDTMIDKNPRNVAVEKGRSGRWCKSRIVPRWRFMRHIRLLFASGDLDWIHSWVKCSCQKLDMVLVGRIKHPKRIYDFLYESSAFPGYCNDARQRRTPSIYFPCYLSHHLMCCYRVANLLVNYVTVQNCVIEYKSTRGPKQENAIAYNRQIMPLITLSSSNVIVVLNAVTCLTLESCGSLSGDVGSNYGYTYLYVRRCGGSLKEHYERCWETLSGSNLLQFSFSGNFKSRNLSFLT